MRTSITSTPAFVLEAIELLTETALEGKVNVGMLGNYVKRTDPGFTPAKYGYSGLLNMLKDYGSLLELIREEGGIIRYGLQPAPVPKNTARLR